MKTSEKCELSDTLDALRISMIRLGAVLQDTSRRKSIVANSYFKPIPKMLPRSFIEFVAKKHCRANYYTKATNHQEAMKNAFLGLSAQRMGMLAQSQETGLGGHPSLLTPDLQQRIWNQFHP